MNAKALKEAMGHISAIMSKNRDYLIELDAQNGDGDLGISMSSGYKAVTDYLAAAEETDLGKLMMQSGKVFNEAAPSSLGTITAFAMMGMAKALKGKAEAALPEVAEAMGAGVAMLMDKAGSKPGEKTILDALCPAIDALKAAIADGMDAREAFAAAAKAAADGSESTRDMRSVHGRAAYYGDKSIGLLDGGSVVGKLIFAAVSQYLCECS